MKFAFCYLHCAAGQYSETPVHIQDYDAEYEHPTKYTSGKASYVERNQAMVNGSDFCVIYFDDTYKPPRRKYRKSYLSDY